MAGFERILIICPPHLVPKWKREVEMTVPGVRAAIVESITGLEQLRLSTGPGPLFAVMSREKAKLSYRWMPAVTQRWATSRGRLIRDEETGEPFRIPCCPDCTAQVADKDGVPLTDADLNRRKHTCAGCNAPLWQADKSGPARYPDESPTNPMVRRLLWPCQAQSCLVESLIAPAPQGVTCALQRWDETRRASSGHEGSFYIG